MLLSALTLALLSATAIADEVSDALSPTPTATIPGYAKLVGTTTTIASSSAAITINQFLGVRFAAAPTDTGTATYGRFSRPIPPAATSTEVSANTKSPACLQVIGTPQQAYTNLTEKVFNTPAPQESEDCLFLNVYAPRQPWTNDTLKPVLFWIYGGAWTFGNAGQPMYDGSHFAALEDVIVVSANYRMNVFGLPQTPAIDANDRNVGLWDQRLAMQWVQDNIHLFGGDKNKVTLFGQSAGAYSIDIHLTATWNEPPPFRAAIMESGTYAFNPLPDCNNSLFGSWDFLAAAVGCNGTDPETVFQCVKSTDANTLVFAQELWMIRFGMACGDTFSSDPIRRHREGDFVRVPMISGSNTEDGSFYASTTFWNETNFFATYFAGITSKFRKEILNAYVDVTPDARKFGAIYTDAFQHCPSLLLSQASQNSTDIYRYLFSAVFPNTQFPNDPFWPQEYQGAYHTSEIPIVFSTYPAEGATADEVELSDTMRRTWADFAKNPDQSPLGGWLPLQSGQDVNVMEFTNEEDGSVAVYRADPTAGRCELWRDYLSQHL